VGSEINHALNLHKPVLVLVSDKYEDKISPIISGNPSETLFLQFYNEDNLKYKVSDFVKYVCATKKRKGKIIVIDGGDDSGKSIQKNSSCFVFKMKTLR
jgi:hypothetical protein